MQTKETKDIQHGDELQLKMQLPEVVYKNLPLMETENMTGDAVNSAVNGDGSKSPAREVLCLFKYFDFVCSLFCL